MQRKPQQLPNPNKMLKNINEQYATAQKKLREGLTKAEEILKAKKLACDASAVVQLGVVLFQLEMSKEQGLIKHKSLVDFIKNQKNHPNRPA